MNTEELMNALHLELATYEDGMVSVDDYIEQTVAVCSEYFLGSGWKNIEKDGLPLTEDVWYDTYTKSVVQKLRYGGQDAYGSGRWFVGEDAGQYWYGAVSHWKEEDDE